MAQLDELIAQAVRWRAEHTAANRHVEASAAALRERALRDARQCLTGEYEQLGNRR